MQTNSVLMLSDHTYDRAKKLVQIVLPAISTLYFTLASIWDFPSTEQVIGSLAAITTFLGVILGVSSKNYQNSDAAFDGQMVVNEVEGTKLFSLELDATPDQIEKMNSVRFKVNPQTAPDA